MRSVGYNGKYYYCYCTKCCHFNHVITEALNHDVHLETSSSFDIDLVLKLYETGKISKSTMQQLSEPACIVNSALFVNLGHDPLSSHTRLGLHLTSNRSDPLSFGGKWQNLIESCSCILITSWGEILVERHVGSLEAQFDILCRHLDMTPQRAVERRQRRAVEQAHAEGAFQQLDTRTHRSLCEVQRLGGLTKVTCAVHLQKGA